MTKARRVGSVLPSTDMTEGAPTSRLGGTKPGGFGAALLARRPRYDLRLIYAFTIAGWANSAYRARRAAGRAKMSASDHCVSWAIAHTSS